MSLVRLYLDTCAIQRPLDDLSQLRVRAEADAVIGLLALCETGHIELVTSGVLVAENEKSPHPDRRLHTDDVLRLAASYAATGPSAVERAARYQSLGLKRFDALHLASAVEAGVEYFCTTDDQLLRRAQSLATDQTVVVSPLALLLRLP